MKMIKITDKNHKKLVDLSKSTGIPMMRIINGMIGYMSDRDMIIQYSRSIMAIFDKEELTIPYVLEED